MSECPAEPRAEISSAGNLSRMGLPILSQFEPYTYAYSYPYTKCRAGGLTRRVRVRVRVRARVRVRVRVRVRLRAVADERVDVRFGDAFFKDLNPRVTIDRRLRRVCRD